MVRGMKSSELFFSTRASTEKIRKIPPLLSADKIKYSFNKLPKNVIHIQRTRKICENQFDVTYHLLTISLYLLCKRLPPKLIFAVFFVQIGPFQNCFIGLIFASFGSEPVFFFVECRNKF